MSRNGKQQLNEIEIGELYRKTSKYLADFYTCPFFNVIQGGTYQTVQLI